MVLATWTLPWPGQVVQRADNFIPRIKSIDWSTFCLLDSDVSTGQSYPLFEQPGPGLHSNTGASLFIKTVFKTSLKGHCHGRYHDFWPKFTKFKL